MPSLACPALPPLLSLALRCGIPVKLLAEQLRGIPWMASGMISLHHLGNFKLSALLAAEHGANHFGFFTTPDGQSPLGTDDAGTTITASQPGTFDTLPAGVGFQAYDSKYPNEVFGPFVKTTLQRLASGWRVAYHSVANDLEGVSYSSIRSGSSGSASRAVTCSGIDKIARSSRSRAT